MNINPVVFRPVRQGGCERALANERDALVVLRAMRQGS